MASVLLNLRYLPIGISVALFLALVAPRLRERRALYAALLGGALAAVLIPFVPPGIPIVAASAVCLVGWRRN